MVDSMLAKVELSPDTPAVHYANAAIALQRKNTKEAKDWIGTAEKNFSPQLNKLFAESLYEMGWLEKPVGQTRASLPLTTAAERAAKAKAFARSRFEQAQQALQQRDFAAAQQFVDEADASDPNQAPILNLRGEILMAQQQFDEAEAAFKKAAKIDPKFREAQFNLADIPFKQKDYAKARDRFEALFQQTPGGDKNQAAQIIKFKIYMTLLLEGKESRAQKMMEQFQFTGDTPALYYAQAAWEFKHNNPTKATDWVASARKIYSPALNNLFGDAFYDLAWLQPAVVASVRPASEAAAAMSTQNETVPAIEPSPIPGLAAVTTKQREKAVASSAPAAQPITGMEATTSRPSEPVVVPVQPPSVIASKESTAAGTPAKPEEVPAPRIVTTAPTVETPAAAQPPPVAQSAPAVESGAVTVATPATVLAPARVAELPQSAGGGARHTWLVGALLLAGILLLTWVIVPELRRRMNSISIYRHAAPVVGPRVDQAIATPKRPATVARSGLVGGPRRISLQLKASEPSLRRGVLTLGKPTRPFAGTPVAVTGAIAEPLIEPSAPPVAAPIPTPELVIESQPEPAVAIAPPIAEPVVEPQIEPVVEVAAVSEPLVEPTVIPVPEEVAPPIFDFVPPSDFVAPTFPSIPEVEQPLDMTVSPVVEPATQPEPEPIPQGQPVPYQIPVSAAEPAVTETVDMSAISPEIFPEPSVAQTTQPVTMPEPTQIPTAPVVRTPATAGTPQPAGGMTAVQLTFSFEIASMQLTPTFKMGALQVRPTSKIVTMRLAPSQQPQPAMNLQVTFEIAKIQPAGGALGTLRLTPSQQQRPTPTGSSSFTVAGLQLVPNFEAAPVQLTPSQQGQAPVLVTAPFQIATVEFSPSFEIASIVLNSTSKQVAVQLPGAGPGGGEAAPMFEIANLQLTGGGDLGMMQLNLLGQGSRRA